MTEATNERFLDTVRDSLQAITHPRFFENERGFQGQLVSELNKRLSHAKALVEQEYQKIQRVHKMRIRPDIIIHEPYDRDLHNSRKDGNFVAMELKRFSTSDAAYGDYTSLDKIVKYLRYPLAIFINIGGSEVYADRVPETLKGKCTAFTTRLQNGQVVLAQKDL